MNRLRQRAKARRFVKDITTHTPFVRMLVYLLALWALFSLGIYMAEVEIDGSSIESYGDALYWGIAAFSTAGIANAPISGAAKILGGIWIVIGSMLFFGTIVATITTYFMKPMQRPHRRIIDTIEYNLEQVGELTIEELDLLRETVDTLIEHVERIKKTQTSVPDNE